MKGPSHITPLVLAAAALVGSACSSSTENQVRTVAISPDSLVLKANRTALLLASVLDASGAQVTGVSVTFLSRNPAVATTTPGGIVTGVAAGLTTVVAEAGSAMDSVKVYVTAGGPLTLTLTPDSLQVAVDSTAPTVAVPVQDGLVAGDVYIAYASSDTLVCTVSATGVVRGVRSGWAWVSAAVGAARDSVRVGVWTPFTASLQPHLVISGGAWGLGLSASAGVVYATQAGGTTIRRIDLPGLTLGGAVTVAPSPLDVVFSANGQTAYTVSASDSLSIVTVATGVATSYPVGEDPWRVVLSADQSRLFVTTTTGTLRVFNAATGAAITSFTATSGAANGVALSADGSKLYIAAYLGGQIAEVTTATLAVRNATLGYDLQEIALSPDGTELYVASEGGPMYVVSPVTLQKIDSIPVLQTFGLLATPDGRFLVATQARTGSIVVIDRRLRRVVRTFAVGGGPRRPVWVAASQTLLVSNDAGGVDIIR